MFIDILVIGIICLQIFIIALIFTIWYDLKVNKEEK